MKRLLLLTVIFLNVLLSLTITSQAFAGSAIDSEILLECVGKNTNHIFGLDKENKTIKTYFQWRLSDLYTKQPNSEDKITITPKLYKWSSFDVSDFKGDIWKEGSNKTRFSRRFQYFYDNLDWFEYELDRETLKFTFTVITDGGDYKSHRESICKIISAEQMAIKIKVINSEIRKISSEQKKQKELKELEQMQKNRI